MGVFKIGEIGSEIEGTDDTVQQIKVLCAVEKGSLPGDPNFGLSISQYIPYREDSKPLVINEILTAIARYQPTVRVSKIDVESERVNVRIEKIGTIQV